MIKNLQIFIERWRSSKNRKHDLDVLIERAQPRLPLNDRLVWLVDLVQWIRFQSIVKDHAEVQNERVPAARIRFLLQLLERNPTWKLRVAQTLRSIISDVRAVDLFCEVGLPSQYGFWSELMDRIILKVMPERPLHINVRDLFTALFPEPDDVAWMKSIDENLFQRLVQLVQFQPSVQEGGWNKLTTDLQDSMVILAADLEGIGLSPFMRRRMQYQNVQELPFVHLQNWTQKIVEQYNLQTPEADLRQTVLGFQAVVRECEKYFHQVVEHLGQFGINQSVVYLLVAGHAKLRRLDDLVTLMTLDRLNNKSVLSFLILLVEENQNNQSLTSLIEKNTRLLARQIVDRSAEAGEHYITRDKQEYKKIFKKAAGGGWLTAFTVYIKHAISWFGLPQFFEGLFFSVNYAASFVAIQLAGFTLATKQPAMTGPALAAKMENIGDEKSLSGLIDEIIHLIRTQSACILGNVGVVVPTVIAFEGLGYLLLRRHLVSQEKAQYVIESLSLLGPTPLYAAFTGVLLWFSSLVAGWFDNWFVLNNMRDTIAYHRDFNFIFGKERCHKFADFIERNISGFSGNISLGLLLGLSPEILGFFGLHLDVRHVTLAAGSLAGAVTHFGVEIFTRSDFWLAAISIFFIGALNVGVSFLLAFLVALRARNVQAPQRRLIYQNLWQRVRQNPLQLIRP